MNMGESFEYLLSRTGEGTLMMTINVSHPGLTEDVELGKWRVNPIWANFAQTVLCPASQPNHERHSSRECVFHNLIERYWGFFNIHFELPPLISVLFHLHWLPAMKESRQYFNEVILFLIRSCHEYLLESGRNQSTGNQYRRRMLVVNLQGLEHVNSCYPLTYTLTVPPSRACRIAHTCLQFSPASLATGCQPRDQLRRRMAGVGVFLLCHYQSASVCCPCLTTQTAEF